MRKFTFLVTIVNLIAMSTIAQEKGNFKDSRDGKTYKTIKIGKQTWMAENLNFKTTNGSWCYEKKTDNCNKYGSLYNWETAKKACPKDWHLPSNEEWEILATDTMVGKKFKETGETNYYAGKEVDSKIGSWWTSTIEELDYASIYWFLDKKDLKLKDHASLIGINSGLSVRCVKEK